MKTGTGYVYNLRHIPSGEDWVALLIWNNKVYAAGWPASIGDLSDCINIEKIRQRTPEETEHLKKAFGIYF